MQKHGILLDGLNDEEIICPGDYIITNRKGEYYRLSNSEFEALYEPTTPPHAVENPTPPIGPRRPQDNPEPFVT